MYWHVHSVLPPDAASVARGTLKFGLVGRGVRGVFCPATNIVDAVVRRRARRDRVHFLPSAIDLDRFPPVGADARRAAREQLGLPQDATVLLHFGWDFKVKGGDYFVQTVAQLAKAGRTGLVGLSRGGGEETEALARELGVADLVRLQPPVEDARSLFAAADLMVSSSREEGMAYTVLEALASGIPVVATPTAGHVYLGEEMDACRIAAADPGDLAGAVEQTLDRAPEVAQAEAGQARTWIDENLAVAVVADELLDLYERDLGMGRGPRPGARAAAASSAPRLVQLASYSTMRAGSFIPMMEAILRAAADRGWRTEAALPETVAGATWLPVFEEAGARVRLLPAGGRSAQNRAVAEIVAEEPGPLIMHSHFTGYDISSALAARRHDDALVFWHHHSALSADPWIVARNLLKFGVLGRRVERIFCPSPDLCEGLRRRLAPADRLQLMPNAVDVARFPVVTRERRAQARERLGIDPDVAVLLNFAWDWEIKGGELFQRAVSRLLADGRTVLALQVGDTEQGLASRQALGLGDDPAGPRADRRRRDPLRRRGCFRGLEPRGGSALRSDRGRQLRPWPGGDGHPGTRSSRRGARLDAACRL